MQKKIPTQFQLVYGVFVLFLCFTFHHSLGAAVLEGPLRNRNLVTLAQKTRELMLISLDWTRPKDPPLSLGHASILANLRKQRISVKERSWSVNNPNFSYKDVVYYIMDNFKYEYTDVALGVFIWNESSVQKILKDLKEQAFPGRIILGGPQISYVEKELEKYYPQADIFIRGYAETSLSKLMQYGGSTALSIKGVHFAGEPDLRMSSGVELEEIPSPFLMGLIKPQPFIRWETQRGCPFKCSFCQHRESDVSMKRRQLSLSRIQQEIDWITGNPIIQDVAVLDPIFNSGHNYLKVLDGLIEGKFSGKLSLQTRIEMVNEDFLDKISRLNETAQTVLEFGLQTIHPQEQMVIGRPNNMRKVARVLEEVRDRNIKNEVSLIFGLPKQTIDSFNKSIDFCREHGVCVIKAFPLMLLRGTPLYYQKQELGLVESNEIVSLEIDRLQEGIPHVVASPSFSYSDWKKMAIIAATLEKESSAGKE